MPETTRCRACGEPGSTRYCCEDRPVFCDECNSVHRASVHLPTLHPPGPPPSGLHHVSIVYRPAGPIERLDDGRLRFPDGGTVELGGVERRIKAGDEIAIRVNAKGPPTLLINGAPADEIGLDS